MQRLHTITSFAALVLLFSSCATILNGPTTFVNIATENPEKIVVENDTFLTDKIGQKIEVTRSSTPLKVEIIRDSTTDNLRIWSKNSAAYYANWIGLPFYAIPAAAGFLVDNSNPKRYTYPKNILINSSDGNLYYNIRKTYALTPYNNIVKTRPFSAITQQDPRVEFAIEHRTSNQFTSQFSAAYMLPLEYYLSDQNNVGYTIALEEKLYFNKMAPHGFYASLEGRFMTREYDAIFNTYNHYPTTIITDTISLVHQAGTINLKIGYQQVVNRIVFDVFLGMGVSQSNVTLFRNNKTPDPDWYSYSHGLLYRNLKEGQHTTASIPFGFQVGWLF